METTLSKGPSPERLARTLVVLAAKLRAAATRRREELDRLVAAA